MRATFLRLLPALALHSFGSAAETPVAPAAKGPIDPERAAQQAWYAALPAAPKPELTKHGLVAEELRRWKARGANQGVAVDAKYFYGIGNFVVGKYDKVTGARVAEWVGLKGGVTTHLNAGIIQDGLLVLAHSNYPQLPMASSIEYFDPATVQPIKSVSLGVRHGELNWAEKKDGFWWACFAHYTTDKTSPENDSRATLIGKFDEHWNVLESWLFPAQVIATWGKMSCSGGAWGDDGLLYTTGHDNKELYVLRLPKMGVTLEYVTTIEVPFEGQSFAWDRGDKRVMYAINRASAEVVVVRVPEVPKPLLQR